MSARDARTPMTSPRSGTPRSGIGVSLSSHGSVISFQSMLSDIENGPDQGPPPPKHWFPRANILEISLSEPRDILQSERTLLTFVRFTTSLYFTAIGMILGFRLRSSGEPTLEPTTPNFNDSLFNRIVSFTLIALAFATLILSGVNYFRTVRRYSQKRIHTYGFNNATMVICVTAIVVTLIGINVSLIVERVMQES